MTGLDHAFCPVCGTQLSNAYAVHVADDDALPPNATGTFADFEAGPDEIDHNPENADQHAQLEGRVIEVYVHSTGEESDS